VIKRYNRISFLWGVPGLGLQVAGALLDQFLVGLLGTLLLIVGFAYYAKSRGRHPAWLIWGHSTIFLPLPRLAGRVEHEPPIHWAFQPPHERKTVLRPNPVRPGYCTIR
jgi:hypothetical protein